MSEQPYTRDEKSADHAEWSKATERQRSDAFTRLLGLVSADALHDEYLALMLREIRAERDGSAS